MVATPPLLNFEGNFPNQIGTIYQKLLQNEAKLLTSSMGRLFDAAACLLELGMLQSFEGEMAMRLEALAWEGVRRTGWDIQPYGVVRWDGAELMMALFTISLQRRNVLHVSIAPLVGWMYDEADLHPGITNLAVSGGVWQNGLLVDMALHFKPEHYNLYFHHQLSPNDEGVSLAN